MAICFFGASSGRLRTGNEVTKERWRALLLELGHRVFDAGADWSPDLAQCDLAIAFHAAKAAAGIDAFKTARPDTPLFLCLTGTDIHFDIHTSAEARRSLYLADRLLVLHPLAEKALPEDVRANVRLVIQSAESPTHHVKKDSHHFDIAVISHLRAVKDPLRAAAAARLLPGSSRIRILHVGGPLEAGWEEAAKKEMAENARYRWLGPKRAAETQNVLLRAHALVLSSRAEGGAIVVSEAIAAGIPVLTSEIDCTVGLLGRGYPGFFPVEDTERLAELLDRFERDAAFRAELQSWCAGRAYLFHPDHEREVWRALLAELPSR